MMSESGPRGLLPDQSSGSGHTLGTARQPYVTDPIPSKRVCFYKSGDPKFHGLRMVINNRTFKSFDALLDSLSKKVPLPFGVRNITTPRGVHAVRTIDELEDGKSYICSDMRKVKPINLALARKKLPPWYNARPASGHRRAAQQPGTAAVRAPKRLVVFRNGDPSIQHMVILQRRSTPTFQCLLDYVSELMQFHVVKLHTDDGRRVDGLPALILCSGLVVAAGREPFKPGNYNALRSPAPTWLPTKQRRLKKARRKKKPVTRASKSRNFSSSSERYFVNQMQKSITGSYCDFPSNPTDSVELEAGHVLESLAETDADTCLGDITEGKSSGLPTEDDIEKSFRVNQDGSMTVEMRVRLTLKEEESIHWTTTLTRSSVASQHDATSFTASEPQPRVGREKSSPESGSPEAKDSTTPIDTVKRKKSKNDDDDDDDDDPPSLGNGIACENGNEEDNRKIQMADVSRRRATPGPRKLSKKQASVESLKPVTAEEIRTGLVSSYIYREQIENGPVTEQYCMVKQSSSRPVPKPRRLGSVETSNRYNGDQSELQASGMAEILRLPDSRNEVTETVLHIVEQQTCQENSLANHHICAQGVSMYGIHYSRPVTADAAGLSPSNGFDSQLVRPSTASESPSMGRTDMSQTSDLTIPSPLTGSDWISILQNKGKERKSLDSNQKAVNEAKMISSKSKRIKKQVNRIMSHKKRQKQAPQNCKKAKPFSSAGRLKRIYGYKPKIAMSVVKLKKKHTYKCNGDDTTKISAVPDDKNKVIKDPNILSPLKKSKSENMLDVSPTELSQSNGALRRQNSTHQHKNEEKLCNDNPSVTLRAIDSSSSVINEYVGCWLEKANLQQSVYSDKELHKVKEVNQMGTDVTSVQPKEARPLEGQNDTQSCPTYQNISVQDSLLGQKVKDRIRSFEKTALQPCPSLKKSTMVQQTINAESAMTNEAFSTNPLIKSKEKNRISNICSEDNPPYGATSEILSNGQAENKLMAMTISVQETSSSPSVDEPVAESPLENKITSGAEHCLRDTSSVASSPLNRRSSSSQRMSENIPFSISPTCDQVSTPTEHTVEKPTPVQTSIPSTMVKVELSRNPSVKRAQLVSNLSFERKMSLRKASVEEKSSIKDASLEPTTASTSGKSAIKNTTLASMEMQKLHGDLIEGTPQSNNAIDLASLASSPLYCLSSSPISLTSEERATSPGLSSIEHPSPIKHKKTKTKTVPHITTQSKASSPKPASKKVILIKDESLENKLSSKKASSEKNELSDRNRAENIHVSSSPSVQREQLQRGHSLKSTSSYYSDPTSSPNSGRKINAAPHSSSSLEMPRKAFLQKRPSPYSQSLDVLSPSMRPKSKKRSISKNLSLDNTPEATSRTLKKKPTQRKKEHRQPSLSKKSPPVLPESSSPTGTIPLNSGLNGNNKTDDKEEQAKQKSFLEAQIIPQANQPSIKPVLEKICYSINSIRQITQNKRPSCLEKSNSMPDFSGHVASTFGSSSKVLLAFLSVMTLKEGITHLNRQELNANNVSCAEALKMIDSLREIASIEDSDKLKTSLSDLQKSASAQLLQNWRGFKKLSEKCSRSLSPNCSKQEIQFQASSEEDCYIEEKAVDELMDEFDIPEKLKEELASLSIRKTTKSKGEGITDASIIEKEELSPKETVKANFPDFPTEQAVDCQQIHTDKANVDVKSLIKQFTNTDPPEESNVIKYQTEDGQLYKAASLGMPSCAETENEENHLGDKEVECANTDTSDHRKSQIKYIDIKVDTEKGSEEESSEENSYDSPEEDTQPSSNKYVELNDSTMESIASPDAEERSTSEDDQPELENGEMRNPACPSEEEVTEQRNAKNVGVNVSAKEGLCSLDAEEWSSSEEVKCSPLQSNKDPISIYTSESNATKQRQPSTNNLMGLNNESISSPDAAGQDTLEENQMIEHLKLKPEDSLHKEENNITDQTGQEAPKHRTKILGRNENSWNLTEDEVSLEDLHHADISQKKRQNIGQHDVTENQDSYATKDQRGTINQPKHYSHDEDEDSGNDVRSCGERVELEQFKAEGELRAEDYSGPPKRDAKGRLSKEDVLCEPAVKEQRCQSEQTRLQSVAERIRSLERQAEGVHQKRNTVESSTIKLLAETTATAPTVLDVEDLTTETHKSHSALFTRSAPQSSLSFSYDSSGIITREPEANRVKTIKEMFQAQSVADIPHGQRGFPTLLDVRTETSDSGGYHTQASSELSGAEDDSSWKSITKGFVKRTIERLYGKKDVNIDEEADQSPPCASKAKKQEASSILSHFQAARSKVISDLSYFSSTNTLATLSEAAQSIAFNAQVVPGDSFPIDKERWLLRENTLIRKSMSDPTGINKTFDTSLQDKDTNDDVPYSLFSKKNELEDPGVAKCTYFSLRHASDSDVCQDDPSIVSVSNTLFESVSESKEDSDATEKQAQKNSTLPAFIPTGFKIVDNKVHPLRETPPDGEVVVAQPGKGHGVVKRPPQETDVLDTIYTFCGQYCPIL